MSDDYPELIPEPDELRRCAEPACLNTFILDAAKRAWFTSRGLHMPRRCPSCRAVLKKQREDREALSLRPISTWTAADWEKAQRGGHSRF